MENSNGRCYGVDLKHSNKSRIEGPIKYFKDVASWDFGVENGYLNNNLIIEV